LEGDIYNNKQKPIKQYEPFYSAEHQYEEEELFSSYGVTPLIHYDPLGRVIRTDMPWKTYNGEKCFFFSKVEFTPWEVKTYDANDTVKDTNYFDSTGNVRTDLELSPDEREALQKAAIHHETPSTTILDTLGREFRTEQKNRYKNPDYPTSSPEFIEETLITTAEFDITGNPLRVIDPRQFELNRSRLQGEYIYTFEYVYDMQGTALRTKNIDSGDDSGFANILGNPVKSWDSKNCEIAVEYDTAQRPVKTVVTEYGQSPKIVEKTVYGEEHPDAANFNMRGKVWKQYDQAGRDEILNYSFKGEPLATEKRLRTGYKNEANWPASGEDSLLETETFTSSGTFDALGRVVEAVNPDSSIMKPEFHQSGALDRVDVKLKGDSTFTNFVEGITYNAKGQREKITYGNNSETTYSYEKETFRLTHLFTKRLNDGEDLQDIRYVYDPVGNIVKLTDSSHDKVFNKNQAIKPEQEYIYDALYRLVEAEGREHMGLNNPDYYKHADSFKQSSFIKLENQNDSQKLANYTRRYSYDESGNLHRLKHIANDSSRSFTRNIAVDTKSNTSLNVI